MRGWTGMTTLNLVDVLEAAYAVERAEGQWLRGLVEALRPALQEGLGMAAYLYDASVRPLAIREPILDCPLDERGLGALMGGSDEAYVRGSWLSKVAATASETPGFAEHPGVHAIFHPVGIHDVMVINVLDPMGIGCLVGAPLGRIRTLAESDRARWEKVAAHVRAALRLRLRLGASSAAQADGASAGARVEAVIDRSGKIASLEGDAEHAGASLREAVLGMERARRSLRRRPDDALQSWRALVRARWTLVHSFEHEDDRYVVARVNGISAAGPAALSTRERQVVTGLLHGHSLKVIAYELDLSYSTVRVLLGRARKKLGVRTREELIARLRDAGGRSSS